MGGSDPVRQDQAPSVPIRTERFQILSLDGGGIRGLFSAAVLAAIEEDLQTSIAKHFDLIAGTSTGGIIAIALGLGLSPAEIVSFYEEHGPRIFSNPLGIRWLRQWVAPKYPVAALEGALRAILRDRLTCTDLGRQQTIGEYSDHPIT